jgi:hypothetical protein
LARQDRHPRQSAIYPDESDLKSFRSLLLDSSLNPFPMKSAARFRRIFLQQVSRHPFCDVGNATGRRRVRRAGQQAKEQAFASEAGKVPPSPRIPSSSRRRRDKAARQTEIGDQKISFPVGSCWAVRNVFIRPPCPQTVIAGKRLNHFSAGTSRSVSSYSANNPS